ncbi:MAG: transporter substrate-binding domain-containing protein [Gemmatimonadota bacterium]
MMRRPLDPRLLEMETPGFSCLALALAMLVFGTVEGAAQAPAPVEPVTVGVRVVPPFVIADGERYSGLTVSLWAHLAEELELDYTFEERDIEGLFAGVEDGSLFASASALTVTAEREERVDFTHPFFTTGLGIAVPHQPAGLSQAVLGLFSTEFLWVFALLGGLLLFWGVLVWLFERAENPDEFGGTPAQGIGSGFWWAAVTMTTVGYGDKSPRSLGGRIVGFVWMFTAIIVISFFTASIASSLTVNQLDSRVSGRQDLPQARVGSLEGAAAVAYLADDGVQVTPYPSIPAGLEALAAGELDAFVHDAPILQYYSRSEFQGRTRVLPGTFLEQYYGIALPLGSEFRDRINVILLDYVASDAWEDLKRQHLGDG